MEYLVYALVVFMALCLLVIATVALRRRMFAKDAMSWLAVLRDGHQKPESILEHFWEKLRKSGYSLEQIGTSEEEISRLTVEGHRMDVKMLIEIFRGAQIDRIDVKTIRDRIALYGFNLSEVGTSESELEELAKKHRELQAKKLVEEFRQIISQIGKSHKRAREIRERIESNKEFSLSDLGTSQAELESCAQ